MIINHTVSVTFEFQQDFWKKINYKKEQRLARRLISDDKQRACDTDLIPLSRKDNLVQFPLQKNFSTSLLNKDI